MMPPRDDPWPVDRTWPVALTCPVCGQEYEGVSFFPPESRPTPKPRRCQGCVDASHQPPKAAPTPEPIVDPFAGKPPVVRKVFGYDADQ